MVNRSIMNNLANPTLTKLGRRQRWPLHRWAIYEYNGRTKNIIGFEAILQNDVEVGQGTGTRELGEKKVNFPLEQHFASIFSTIFA